MIGGGSSVAPLGTPDTPLSEWEPLDGSNYAVLAKKIPCITPGMQWRI